MLKCLTNVGHNKKVGPPIRWSPWRREKRHYRQRNILSGERERESESEAERWPDVTPRVTTWHLWTIHGTLKRCAVSWTHFFWSGCGACCGWRSYYYERASHFGRERGFYIVHMSALLPPFIFVLKNPLQMRILFSKRRKQKYIYFSFSRLHDPIFRLLWFTRDRQTADRFLVVMALLQLYIRGRQSEWRGLALVKNYSHFYLE